uniref:Uncharacterized protein n=1 Tax=Anguilla anguilla TaxID=7936 RepID=A0A0E9SS27_ANGAN
MRLLCGRSSDHSEI